MLTDTLDRFKTLPSSNISNTGEGEKLGPASMICRSRFLIAVLMVRLATPLASVVTKGTESPSVGSWSR